MEKYNAQYCKSLPKFDRSVSCLCWAYNEELLIRDFLVRMNNLLKNVVKDYEIIVVNDQSTDRTYKIVRDLQSEIPRIKLLQNHVNMDVGLAMQRAIKAATMEYLFWQTIDWSYDIKYLRIFLELLKNYDIVAGARREPVKSVDGKWKPILTVVQLFGINHITKRSDTIIKAIISIINYIFIHILFRIPLSDFQNVCFYPTKLAQAICYESKSSFSNPEGLIKSYWNEARIVEVPISFIPRQKGDANGTRLKAIKAAVFDIFRLWFKWIVLNKIEKKKGKVYRFNVDEWDVEYPKRLSLFGYFTRING